MSIVLGLVIAVIIVIALLGVIAMIVAAVLWLLAAVLVAGLAAAASFAIAIVIQHLGEAWGYSHADLAGAICGVAFFVSAMAYAARRYLPPDTRSVETEPRPLNAKVTALPEPEGEGDDEDFAPEADRHVRAAWQTIEELAPGQRARVKVARRKCAQVLALGEGDTIDPSLIELSMMLKRNLPQLANTVAKLCATASRSKRNEAIRGLVEDVERLAQSADRELARHHEALSDELLALRAHIATRTSA